MTELDELLRILKSRNGKLSLDELKQVIYDKMIECARRSHCVESGGVLIDRVATSDTINPYWQGKQNAFQIVLDLLEHLDDCSMVYQVGDTVYVPWILGGKIGLAKLKLEHVDRCEEFDSWITRKMGESRGRAENENQWN